MRCAGQKSIMWSTLRERRDKGRKEKEKRWRRSKKAKEGREGSMKTVTLRKRRR